MHTIKLNKHDHTLRVINRTNKIRLNVVTPTIRLNQTGMRGPQGIQGEQGEIGPQGPQGEPGVDANYVYPFTNQSTIVVAHNLNKLPAVAVMDSTGDEVIGQVEYTDINTVTIRFIGSFTGVATFN